MASDACRASTSGASCGAPAHCTSSPTPHRPQAVTQEAAGVQVASPHSAHRSRRGAHAAELHNETALHRLRGTQQRHTLPRVHRKKIRGAGHRPVWRWVPACSLTGQTEHNTMLALRSRTKTERPMAGRPCDTPRRRRTALATEGGTPILQHRTKQQITLNCSTTTPNHTHTTHRTSTSHPAPLHPTGLVPTPTHVPAHNYTKNTPASSLTSVRVLFAFWSVAFVARSPMLTHPD